MALADRLPTRTRLIPYYVAFFSVAGIHLPYWPTWLQSQGMGPGEISLLLAIAPWIRVLVNPLVSNFADASGRRKEPLVWCALAAFVVPLNFLWAEGFWPLLLVSLVFGAVWAPIGPFGENLALAASIRERFDYGRVRLFGSLSFMAATLIGGQLLAGAGGDGILFAVLATCLANALCCRLLPDPQIPAAEKARGAPVRRLLGHPLFLVFLLAASLQQASHATYYGFSVIEWQKAGLDARVVGLLWAEGVVAEILVFLMGAAILRRIGPAWLLLLGAVAGLVRWPLTAMTTDLTALVALQLLHGATFGLAHLAAMHFIARATPAVLSASAQGLYSTVSAGLFLGLSFIGAGKLYGLYGSGAYYAMAGLSGIAALGLLWLALRWRGAALDA